ncbi:hypothetical protein IAD21_06440 (plasmid) [Abditibacteriota bacterium]|nr:hypothetical protein IAD21_06440 [Abditibacteriota bacterium]
MKEKVEGKHLFYCEKFKFGKLPRLRTSIALLYQCFRRLVGSPDRVRFIKNQG